MTSFEPENLLTPAILPGVRAKEKKHKDALIRRTLLRRRTSIVAGETLRTVSVVIVIILPLLLLTLIVRSLPLLEQTSLDNLLGQQWNPARQLFGLSPFVVGSLCVTGLSMLIAVPISVGSAVCLSEYMPNRARQWIRPLVELLAGIPSVVYGLWGVLVIVPAVRSLALALHADQTTGYSILSASLVLALMVTPFMIALMEEVFRATPYGTRYAALALGATKWEVVKDVLFRHSYRSLIATIALGSARALGETLAVLMVVGNVARFPHSLFSPAYPLTALFANNFGEMMSVPLYDSALMFSALLLLIMVLMFNLGSKLVIRQVAQAHE